VEVVVVDSAVVDRGALPLLLTAVQFYGAADGSVPPADVRHLRAAADAAAAAAADAADAATLADADGAPADDRDADGAGDSPAPKHASAS
jgi:hypothetical protein